MNEENIQTLIPGKILMISGCRDPETSSDAQNISSFKLPDPAGRSGGACTSALLSVLYSDNKPPSSDLGWVETLEAMRHNLKSRGFKQVPQLTSSRMIDVSTSVSFVNTEQEGIVSGTKRAVLIGINYIGTESQLSGCHNDVLNMKRYLMAVHGFEELNMAILMDDGKHINPTRDNMMKALQDLAHSSRPGDTCILHYSGHGGYVRDENGDEEDRRDETLVPLDYNTAGQIRDDDLFKALVLKIPKDVLLMCLMDSCHSGTVLDLPYKYIADGTQKDMIFDTAFNMEHLQKVSSLQKKAAADIERLIPAKVMMISGCRDQEYSSDVQDINSFKLPDPAGRSGGACTSALLSVLYADNKPPANDLGWVETLEAMREKLKSQGYEQIPQLTSSRMIDVNSSVSFVNTEHEGSSSGTRRAVLIGINYVGTESELSGCHNDVLNIKRYLMAVHGFEESNIVLLMDDGKHILPTRNNIMKAFQDLAQSSRAGDTCVLHYSGHGGNVKDVSGDEPDRRDETLVPLDFDSAGHIIDDDLFKALVVKIPKGALLMCLMDSCHSGTVLDLPYKFVADGKQREMTLDAAFKMNHLHRLASTSEKVGLKLK